MKATELRIGNYVYDNYDSKRDGSPLQIVSVTELSYFEDDEDSINNTDSNFFEPIPLTEIWLKRFRFKKVRDKYIMIKSYHYENKVCWIYLIQDGFELELNTGIERNNLHRTYKYVHELQNLYHAITGSELITKN